ncbi:MAG: hypothetical protein H0U67_01010 [Gemmatimonadetes bacterium]|jgi:hypothetical protein|nr:hypothetical protein [Gemmatimonadota bacterium]
MMKEETDPERLRREGAEAERVAIIGIVERHMRLVAHGHGADGAQVLQHLLVELEERERAARNQSEAQDL